MSSFFTWLSVFVCSPSASIWCCVYLRTPQCGLWPRSLISTLRVVVISLLRQPITMLRNALGKEEGGSGEHLSLSVCKTKKKDDPPSLPCALLYFGGPRVRIFSPLFARCPLGSQQVLGECSLLGASRHHLVTRPLLALAGAPSVSRLCRDLQLPSLAFSTRSLSPPLCRRVRVVPPAGMITLSSASLHRKLASLHTHTHIHTCACHGMNTCVRARTHTHICVSVCGWVCIILFIQASGRNKFRTLSTFILHACQCMDMSSHVYAYIYMHYG